jgi:hypothetical protein
MVIAPHLQWAAASVALAALAVICISLGPPQSAAAAAPQAKERIDLLIDGGTAVTMAADHRVIDDAAIAIRGDTIIAVGPRSGIIVRYAPARRLAAHGQLILPGLIRRAEPADAKCGPIPIVLPWRSSRTKTSL